MHEHSERATSNCVKVAVPLFEPALPLKVWQTSGCSPNNPACNDWTPSGKLDCNEAQEDHEKKPRKVFEDSDHVGLADGWKTGAGRCRHRACSCVNTRSSSSMPCAYPLAVSL